MKGFKVKGFFVFFLVAFFSGALYAQEIPEDMRQDRQEEALSDYVPSAPVVPRASFFNFVGLLLKLGLSLTIIIVFIYIAVFILKMLSVPQRHESAELSFGSLFMVDSVSLRLNQAIYLVYAGKDILIVASSDKGVSLLSKIEDPSIVSEILKKREEKWKKAKPFGEYLQSAKKKYHLKMYMKEYFNSLKQIFGRKK